MTSEPANTIVLTQPSVLEIKMERSFAAPVEHVFRAMTDPDLVSQWWGLRSTTTVVEAFDLRPGSRWRFGQKGSNGEEWGFSGEIREVDPPRKVVQTFSFDPMPGSILETMTLE